MINLHFIDILAKFEGYFSPVSTRSRFDDGLLKGGWLDGISESNWLYLHRKVKLHIRSHPCWPHFGCKYI